MLVAAGLYCFFVIIHITSTDASKIKRNAPSFSDGVKVGTVKTGAITEASGICASRRHPHVLYTHNDSGGTNRIFAIDATSGHRIATITINGAEFSDWEDIACGPCPGGAGHCVYIADTGNHKQPANIIYRIREPDTYHGHMAVKLESYLKFSWDQPDCETLMVDNRGEVYVVSKVSHGQGKLVHLPSHAWDNRTRTAVYEGVVLPLYTHGQNPVGGDISRDGREVLIKTYDHVLYWHVPDGDYYGHMQQGPRQLPYHHEAHGEAVCWDAMGDGYYTLSEGHHSPLYYYSRRNVTLPQTTAPGEIHAVG